MLRRLFQVPSPSRSAARGSASFRQVSAALCVATAALLPIPGSAQRAVPLETPLYYFGSNTNDGGRPVANLVQGSNGLFYGATLGTDATAGTLFSVTASGALATLHTFGAAGDGISPVSALVQASDGSFYGVTSDGGAFAQGTVFRINASGTYSLLHSFAGNDGSTPRAALVQGSDGNFYGCTTTGGNGGPFGNNGTVFRMTPEGSLTTLHAFTGADGANPAAALIQSVNGFFFGTTQGGGANGDGSVFRISTAGAFTSIHSFGGATDGTITGYTGPGFAGLVEAPDGNFYGTTLGDPGSVEGFGNFGSVYRLTRDGLRTTLHAFNRTDGAYPRSGVVIGGNGDLYGATQQGGANGVGSLFRLALADNTLTTLHSFRAQRSDPDGSQPNGLIRAASGVYYGTTAASTRASRFGGVDPATEVGTVFSLHVDVPGVVISVSPTPAAARAEATLTWSSTGATACTASGAWRGARAVNGSLTISQTKLGDHVYTLTCSNPAGSGSADATLRIAAAPTVSVKITPAFLNANKTSATLTWTSERADSCTASGEWTGPRPFNGSLQISPQARGQHLYTLICTGIGGSAADSASVFQFTPSP